MQHQYYGTDYGFLVYSVADAFAVPLMFVTTFGAPLLIGLIWDDATTVFVWACLVKCLLGV